MRANRNTHFLPLLVSIAFMLSLAANAFGDEYDGMKGVDAVKAVFDFNISDLNSAAGHLGLIYQTFKDASVWIKSKRPDFVVIIFGPSTKYVTNNREGFTPDQQLQLDKIAGFISKLAKEGVQLEICMTAAHMMGVDPATILPEIKPVGNGWISLIGYQRRGYALVPLF